jgi:hypothetical protein
MQQEYCFQLTFPTKMVFPIEQGFQIQCIQNRESTVRVLISFSTPSGHFFMNFSGVLALSKLFLEEVGSSVVADTLCSLANPLLGPSVSIEFSALICLFRPTAENLAKSCDPNWI